MTIAQAIARADALMPNAIPQNIKIDWLSNLDSMIVIEVIRTHEGDEEYASFAGYDENTDVDSELIVPAPFSEMYPIWIAAKIDFTNGEFDRYGNVVAQFNSILRDFADHYNRTHTPKGVNINYWGKRKDENS